MTTLVMLLAYGLVATLLLALVYASRSARLQNRFKRLGRLEGRALDEIVKFAGKPSYRARLAPNREVLEWRRIGFHIALAFTDDVCDGVEYVEGRP
jgi:hypothetical protein